MPTVLIKGCSIVLIVYNVYIYIYISSIRMLVLLLFQRIALSSLILSTKKATADTTTATHYKLILSCKIFNFHLMLLI